jgi:hypothetical protein
MTLTLSYHSRLCNNHIKHVDILEYSPAQGTYSFQAEQHCQLAGTKKYMMLPATLHGIYVPSASQLKSSLVYGKLFMKHVSNLIKTIEAGLICIYTTCVVLVQHIHLPLQM